MVMSQKVWKGAAAPMSVIKYISVSACQPSDLAFVMF
jgi:hypothetical protein